MELLLRRKWVLTGCLLIVCVFTGYSRVVLGTEGLKLSLDKKGQIRELLLGSTFENHRLKDSTGYFLTLYADGRRHIPVSVRFNRSDSLLRFMFREPVVSIDIRCTVLRNYLTFEVVRAEPAGRIEAIQWGPLFTTISEEVGEVAGVVRDGKTAFGMLLLNIETLGGEYNRNGICEGRGCLARSAGYNAGFAMVARMKDVRGNQRGLRGNKYRTWESPAPDQDSDSQTEIKTA